MVNVASDYITIGQFLEGNRVADLQWGTVNAKQIIVNGHIVVLGDSFTQTICLSVRNASNDRSYVVEIAYFDGSYIDMDFTAVIPGCTTGVWNKDTLQGMSCFVSLWAGTNYRTTPNTWATGNFLGSTAMTNANTNILGNSLHLSRMGLYADPYKTGVAPPFEAPDYATELRRCQRYWYRAYGLQGGVASGTIVSRAGMRHPTPMRTTPTGTIRGAPRIYDGTTTALATSLGSACNNMAAEFDITTGGTFATGGKAAAMYYQTDNDYIEVNARM